MSSRPFVRWAIALVTSWLALTVVVAPATALAQPAITRPVTDETGVLSAAAIDAIEARYAVRRKALEFEMRAANARLAEAIEEEHGYGPKVTAAIDHSHTVMGALQKETLEHLFAMREVLNPEQAKMFDSTVVKALTADAR